MKQPTILFQPPNTTGLGHMSRLIAIALEVRRAAPLVRTPFLVEGEGHGMFDHYDLPQISLPRALDVLDTPKWSSFAQDRRRQLLVDSAVAVLHNLAPDLVVFDCFPHLAMQRAVVERNMPVVVCLRKQRDLSRPFDIIREYRSLVRLVVLPHAEEECEVPEELRPLVRFTGTIVRSPPPAPDLRVPRNGSRLIVISGGGGGFPGTVRFYNLAIEAFLRARAHEPRLEALLVTGPLFKEWWDLTLADGVRIIPFDPRMSLTFAAADLVVCQAGYNTVGELVTLGVPAIAVPGERHMDDQVERAMAVANASTTFRVFDGAGPEALGAMMTRMLARPRLAAPTGLPRADGARLAAEALLDVLTGLLPRELGIEIRGGDIQHQPSVETRSPMPDSDRSQ